MRPVINTEKHYVQFSLASVGSGAITNLDIIDAVAVPTALDEVREGSKISAVYIEMWLHSDDATSGSVICTLEKLSGDMSVIAVGEIAALGSYVNKKNVFYTQMGLLPNNVSYPMSVIKGWFKIPKSKQRFGLGDSLVLSMFGQSNGFFLCGFATYKEQY